MKKQLFLNSVACAVLGACLTAQADVVTDWNTAALNAIRADKTPPPKASRGLAILHTAIFDAVNGIKQPREEKIEPYLITKKGHPKASEAAAASAAAHVVLTALHPAQQAAIDAQYAAALAAIRDGKDKLRGIEYGEFVARASLAARANDGSTNVVAPPALSGPGYWVPTPPANAAYLLPQWAFVEPFVMNAPSQFRPPGPPALGSAQYAAEYNEVKTLGAKTGSTRTADQDQIALFWADGGGTETPPGHWNHIAQDVAAAEANTLDENARLFALLNIALADAAICAWDAKYTFDFWRPVTAIHNGDLDGNAATVADTNWLSFIGTPPFPDYVSGHSAFSGAASTVLAAFYGTDRIPFTTGSDFLPGVQRSFPGFSAAATEAALSRLYGGIHFSFANLDGLRAGTSIGRWTMRNALRPKGQQRGHARDDK